MKSLEGGSGIHISDSILPSILARNPVEGGLFIADGSNSRGGKFKKLTRQSGRRKHGWNFARRAQQLFVNTPQLYLISVMPAAKAGVSRGGSAF